MLEHLSTEERSLAQPLVAVFQWAMGPLRATVTKTETLWLPTTQSVLTFFVQGCTPSPFPMTVCSR